MNIDFEQYKALDIDGRLISLEHAEEIAPYFCYPINAEAIGFEGCIMYCFIEGYEEMVFASNPESCADTYVYPLARNFKEFLGLIVACGSANPIEQIVWMSKEQFEQHIKEEQAVRTNEQNIVLQQLKNKMDIAPIDNPYEYVKEIQKNFDSSKIEYSDEYYDFLGIER